MTDYVLLVPPGVTVTQSEALVDDPVLLPADQLERWARAERLRRELRELESDLGVAAPEMRYLPEPEPLVRPAPEPERGVAAAESLQRNLGADGVWRTERHATAKQPNSVHACICGRAYSAPQRLAEHRRQCGEYRKSVVLDGHAEDGSYRFGKNHA